MKGPQNSKQKKLVKQSIKIKNGSKKLDLTKQFEQFKQRIQQFENKNQEIIGRIRDAYNFKKKNIQIADVDLIYDKSRIVYYQNQEAGEVQSNASSCNYSNNPVLEGNLMRHYGMGNPTASAIYQIKEDAETKSLRVRQPKATKRKSPQVSYSQHFVTDERGFPITSNQQRPKLPMNHLNYDEYMKNKINMHYKRDSSPAMNRQTSHDPQNISQQYGFGYDSVYDTKITGQFQYQDPQIDIDEYQQNYQHQIAKSQQLQEQLTRKDEEIKKLKGIELRLKSYNNTMKIIFQSNLQNFHQEVVRYGFQQMQRSIKKFQTRIRNLTYKVKDALEEKRSRKMINQSKSSRKVRPKSYKRGDNSSSSSLQMRKSREKIKRQNSREKLKEPELSIKMSPNSSQIKLANKSEIARKNKEFQQIAQEYEGMIKSVKQDNQKLEVKLKQQENINENINLEFKKIKALLIEREKQLKEHEKKKASSEQHQKVQDQQQEKLIKQKLSRYEQQLRIRQAREKDLEETIKKIQKSKKMLHEEYLQNLNKNKNLKNEAIRDLQLKLKDMSQSSNSKSDQIQRLKDQLSSDQKKMMEKECQIFLVNNKVKKLESEVANKDEKIKQLQKLLIKENQHGDILEKSLSMDNSAIVFMDLKYLQENIKKLQEQVEQKKLVIFNLEKGKNEVQNNLKYTDLSFTRLTQQKKRLQERILILNRDLQEKILKSDKEINYKIEQKQNLIEDLQEQKGRLMQQIEEFQAKNGDFATQVKKLKDQNLNISRQLIKWQSQYNFAKQELSNVHQKFQKIKEQNEDFKSKILQKQQQINDLQSKASCQLDKYKLQLEQIRNKHEQKSNQKEKDQHEEQNLLNSLNISELSLNINKRRVMIEEQNQNLREKVKQIEAALEMKLVLQKKVDDEYKNNIDKIRDQLIEKQKQNQKLLSENEQMRREIKSIKKDISEDVSFDNYKIHLYEEKIVQLESQLEAAKNSEERLNEMIHSVFDSVRDKEEERQKLIRDLEDREKQLEELRDLLELKQVKLQSVKSMKQEKIAIKESNFSLKYSVELNDQNSDLAQLSYLSNISDVFKRDDILQQRIKRGRTSRDEQVKLFEKTSAYIKSLKVIIDSKQKRIKILEKNLSNLKNRESEKWNPNRKDQLSGEKKSFTQEYNDGSEDDCEEYKDYESVQLDTKRSRYFDMVKQLQHEKNLANQENKMLLNQIQLLQEQINKAEQQQNSLVKIKDLYKEEIKKLIDRNENRAKEFEIQIQRLRVVLEESESVHNMEAIRQLFLKIIYIVAYIEDASNKQNKKDEKRKELQEYIKVMCSILRMDINTRDRLISSIKK